MTLFHRLKRYMLLLYLTKFWRKNTVLFQYESCWNFCWMCKPARFQSIRSNSKWRYLEKSGVTEQSTYLNWGLLGLQNWLGLQAGASSSNILPPVTATSGLHRWLLGKSYQRSCKSIKRAKNSSSNNEMESTLLFFKVLSCLPFRSPHLNLIS